MTYVTTVSDADGAVSPIISGMLVAQMLALEMHWTPSTISINPDDTLECRVTVDDGVDSDTDSADIISKSRTCNYGCEYFT